MWRAAPSTRARRGDRANDNDNDDDPHTRRSPLAPPPQKAGRVSEAGGYGPFPALALAWPQMRPPPPWGLTEVDSPRRATPLCRPLRLLLLRPVVVDSHGSIANLLFFLAPPVGDVFHHHPADLRCHFFSAVVSRPDLVNEVPFGILPMTSGGVPV